MGPFIKDVIHRGGGFFKFGQKGRHPNYIIFGEISGKLPTFVQIDGLYLLHIDKFNGT